MADNECQLQSAFTTASEILREGLLGLIRSVKYLFDNFVEGITQLFSRVRSTLWNVVCWLGRKLTYAWGKATEFLQNIFTLNILRVNRKINVACDTAKKRYDGIVGKGKEVKIKYDGIVEKGKEVFETMFKDAKVDDALQKNMENNNNCLNPKTLDLVKISDRVAEKLRSARMSTLEDVEVTFEALSDTIIDEFNNKMEMYYKTLYAASAGARGNTVDIEVFNQKLGIEGSPIEHYWQEAIVSTMEERLANKINENMANKNKRKKIMIKLLSKPSGSSVEGLYRVGGVKGSGKLTADQLISALRQKKFDLSEELVVNETESEIMIQTRELTLATMMELNSNNNTSEGILLVIKREVLKPSAAA